MGQTTTVMRVRTVDADWIAQEAARRSTTPATVIGDLVDRYRQASLVLEAEAAAAHKRSDVDAQFDEFWAKYPRKTNKPPARRAWARLTVAQRRAALDAIALHVTLWRKRGTDVQFIPHPATWLNGHRFDDDPASLGVTYNERYDGLIDADYGDSVQWYLWCETCIAVTKEQSQILMMTYFTGDWDGTDTHRCIDGTTRTVSIERDFDPTFGFGPWWNEREQRVGRRSGAFRIAIRNGRAQSIRLRDLRGENCVVDA